MKFQKRTVDVVLIGADELARPRESPFGTTNGDLKRGLEFGLDAYAEIDRHCRSAGMPWFASCWDELSVDFIESFDVPCYKIASAGLTDDELLAHHRRKGRPVLLSTGMSTLAQIDHAVDVLGDDRLVLLHCTSTYPAKVDELNLKMIPALARALRRAGRLLGPRGRTEHHRSPPWPWAPRWSNATSRSIARMWGSDQAASVEPAGHGAAGEGHPRRRTPRSATASSGSTTANSRPWTSLRRVGRTP